MVLSQDGIFSRAEKATDKYGQAKARETLELTLGEAQMQKHEEGLSDEQLDNKIASIAGELLPKEKPENPNLQNVIVDGYIFEIDRSVPKIVDYIGPADGVVITAVINGLSNGWMKPDEVANISVTGKIVTYSGGNITTVNATKDGNPISGFSINSEGKYEITGITTDTTIIVNAKDSNNKENSRTIPITIRIDNVKPIVDNIDTSESKGLTIKFKATGMDNESGISHFNYIISSTTDTELSGIPKDKKTGTFKKDETVTILATKDEIYTITVTAEDNVGNTSVGKSQTVETWGVIKHIKMNDGTLKEICTVDIYGVNVTGYNCYRTDAEWQIFYIDEDDDHRVYLIAKDYMVPPVNNATPTLIEGMNSNCPKAYRFAKNDGDLSVLGNFTETIPDTAFTTKFLNEYKGANATLKNLQATNYMLNQDIWTEYKDTIKAEYTYGGPTLPLFQASYNDISKKTTKLEIKTNDFGYLANKRNEGWKTYIDGLGEVGLQNGIYFLGNSEDSAECMWIASPAGNNEHYMMFSRYNGGLIMNIYGGHAGFRPIVSLQSNVQFIDNGNGTYTID